MIALKKTYERCDIRQVNTVLDASVVACVCLCQVMSQFVGTCIDLWINECVYLCTQLFKIDLMNE